MVWPKQYPRRNSNPSRVSWLAVARLSALHSQPATLPLSTFTTFSELTIWHSPYWPSRDRVRRFHQVILALELTDFKYSVDFFVTMSSPASTDGHLVEHRRDTRIILDIEIRSRSMGTNLPWDCIRIPQTKSVKRSAAGNKRALDFRVEVKGATTGNLRDSLCRTCTLREPQNSLIPRTVVDFTSKTDIIDLKNGKAEVAFRFLCLSTHHGVADSEYR